ncbi:putative hydrolase (HD superfamily) [Nocardioides ginsengisegetis]|uniref:Putative hydrolase (HD superfamily) n=1 Tax=Nocardioides ginsengisegetis TaxID=661491 RepID=A0A7W3J3C4_9ACTN|nr:HD domain-containing protein [Nocardioides ginsengisegetis]MBA8805459.1 putative hydrolase (HD superfamily) [Nocardioides ginsengisegetis]
MSWTATDCESVAREFVEPLGDRWKHVQGVAETAATWSGVGAEAGFIVGSAWLHDIGYAPELHQTGMHAIDGALFLDLAGAPREIVSLVAFHTGAEFEAEERGLIDKLIQFDRPRQEWIDALILADLVTGSDGARVTVGQRLDSIFERYEAQHPVHRAVTRSREYLETCAARAAKRVGYPT